MSLGTYEVCIDLDGPCETVRYDGSDTDVTITLKKFDGKITGKVLLEGTDGSSPVPLNSSNFSAAKSGHPPYVKAMSGVDGTFEAAEYVSEGRSIHR